MYIDQNPFPRVQFAVENSFKNPYPNIWSTVKKINKKKKIVWRKNLLSLME